MDFVRPVDVSQVDWVNQQQQQEYDIFGDNEIFPSVSTAQSERMKT
jgi:hypothetical protein